MAKIILSILLVCLIATVMMVSADPAPFKQCMSNGVFFPQSLDITPAKPKAGDTLVAVATGTVSATVPSGILYADIYLSGVRLFEFTYDLCKSVSGGCPITPGTKAITIQNSIPSFAFPGTYNTVASAYADASKTKEIACVSFNFTIA
ncbi:phosphatidylinositol/phosphatidylglycerol transfer protein [Naegleria gruberi]|uniref:Phosphatidylinositol/phosphatidylglycerol transfer protein n=1 Tax=Naegleria gruberi TaxID=5762 RepID=D2V2I5_NAEGR|nr:phosphatidylinositol/phosphatidylglycerol transfer protein [Naegleria gruberi]EFC49065.1 phosphatidylinositol/phosphatidylglycerol transfer protein [Naegleria gruberi]|eukprot:XP_002681809.1 phosphatidylinositol/phosphatidylglycerol transfer protein [Naegleria gruberi strain NEG-M]